MRLKLVLAAALFTYLVLGSLLLLATPELVMMGVRSRLLALTGPNTLFNREVLVRPGMQRVVRPNTDTLYTTAWLDLSGGAMVLTLPPLGERYFSFQFLASDTTVSDVVSLRNLDVSAPRRVLILPPWLRECSGEYDAIVSLKESQAWLLGRTLVDGETDLATAVALIRRYDLAPAEDC